MYIHSIKVYVYTYRYRPVQTIRIDTKGVCERVIQSSRSIRTPVDRNIRQFRLYLVGVIRRHWPPGPALNNFVWITPLMPKVTFAVSHDYRTSHLRDQVLISIYTVMNLPQSFFMPGRFRVTSHAGWCRCQSLYIFARRNCRIYMRGKRSVGTFPRRPRPEYPGDMAKRYIFFNVITFTLSPNDIRYKQIFNIDA